MDHAGPLDAVVSTDGDSDRPLILGIENGRAKFFGGDLVGMIVAEYLGADTVVACSVGAGRVLARLPGKVDLAKGAAIHLAYESDAIHLFDAVNGQAVRHPAAQ